MPFTGDILQYKSMSIVGLEKNTGKTECLNYILKRLEHLRHRIVKPEFFIEAEPQLLVKNCVAQPQNGIDDQQVFDDHR